MCLMYVPDTGAVEDDHEGGAIPKLQRMLKDYWVECYRTYDQQVNFLREYSKITTIY